MPFPKEITKRGKHKQMILIFKKSKMVNLNPSLSIIILNVNGQNILIKSDRKRLVQVGRVEECALIFSCQNTEISASC